ncbi:unnamed protein product, partial [Oikopleura dioica]
DFHLIIFRQICKNALRAKNGRN